MIGSLYAGKLLAAGHEVVLFARGQRLVNLQTSGLILTDAESEQQTVWPVTAVDALGPRDRYDLVLVAVRSEQLASTLPVLSGMSDGSDVLFMGNTAGLQGQLSEALGGRALFGFPAAGDARNGAVIRYVLIRQQKTMLGELIRAVTPRTLHLKKVLEEAGFSDSNYHGRARLAPGTCRIHCPDRIRSVPLRYRGCTAGYRPGNSPVDGTGKRVLAGPRGELWFAAHTRAAPEEMNALAKALHTAVRRIGGPEPDLARLLQPIE